MNARVQQLRRLLSNRSDTRRIAVTDVHDPDATGEVDQFATRFVNEYGSAERIGRPHLPLVECPVESPPYAVQSIVRWFPWSIR